MRQEKQGRVVGFCVLICSLAVVHLQAMELAVMDLLPLGMRCSGQYPAPQHRGNKPDLFRTITDQEVLAAYRNEHNQLCHAAGYDQNYCMPEGLTKIIELQTGGTSNGYPMGYLVMCFVDTEDKRASNPSWFMFIKRRVDRHTPRGFTVYEPTASPIAMYDEWIAQLFKTYLDWSGFCVVGDAVKAHGEEDDDADAGHVAPSMNRPCSNG